MTISHPVKLGLGLLLIASDVIHGHAMPFVHPAEHLTMEVTKQSRINLTGERSVCQYNHESMACYLGLEDAMIRSWCYSVGLSVWYLYVHVYIYMCTCTI